MISHQGSRSLKNWARGHRQHMMPLKPHRAQCSLRCIHPLTSHNATFQVPPDHAPQLLFPCGHTFCAACINTHMGRHGKTHCPICRKKIDSRVGAVALFRRFQRGDAQRVTMIMSTLITCNRPFMVVSPIRLIPHVGAMCASYVCKSLLTSSHPTFV